MPRGARTRAGTAHRRCRRCCRTSLVFIAWRRHTRASRSAILALVLALWLDAHLREFADLLSVRTDPLFRLWPHYAHRAASVFFTQTLWPMVMVCATVVLTSLRAPVRAGLAAAGIAAALTVLLVPASTDVRLRLVHNNAHARQPSAADLRNFLALEREIVPPGDAFLVSAITQWMNRRKWVVAFDDARPFYAHAARPTVFFYFTSLSAAVSASDLERMCAAMARGDRRPWPIGPLRARWVAAVDNGREPVRMQVGHRFVRGRGLGQWFPDLEVVGQLGRVAIARLWRDARD